MPFTIIIPTHGRATLLRRTLESLAECEFPDGFRETVVIENGSRDGAEQVCQEFAAACRIRYLHEPIGNKSRALNRVLNEVTEGLLIFFDDDVRIAPQTLRAYVEAAGNQSNVFFGGPMAVDYESTPPPEWLKTFLPSSQLGWRLDSSEEQVANAVFLGCNWAARAEDLHEVGGFNEDVGPGATSGSTGQEAEMQSRLLSNGKMGSYVPDAQVWHFVTSEQCTPHWVLQRAFRHAVFEGLNMQDHSPQIFGSPRWLLKKIGLQWIKAMLCSLIQRDAAAFEKWYKYYQLRGILHGYRHRANASLS